MPTLEKQETVDSYLEQEHGLSKRKHENPVVQQLYDQLSDKEESIDIEMQAAQKGDLSAELSSEKAIPTKDLLTNINVGVEYLEKIYPDLEDLNEVRAELQGSLEDIYEHQQQHTSDKMERMEMIKEEFEAKKDAITEVVEGMDFEPYSADKSMSGTEQVRDEEQDKEKVNSIIEDRAKEAVQVTDWSKRMNTLAQYSNEGVPGRYYELSMSENGLGNSERAHDAQLTVNPEGEIHMLTKNSIDPKAFEQAKQDYLNMPVDAIKTGEYKNELEAQKAANYVASMAEMDAILNNPGEDKTNVVRHTMSSFMEDKDKSMLQAMPELREEGINEMKSMRQEVMEKLEKHEAGLEAGKEAPLLGAVKSFNQSNDEMTAENVKNADRQKELVSEINDHREKGQENDNPNSLKAKAEAQFKRTHGENADFNKAGQADRGNAGKEQDQDQSKSKGMNK